MNKKHIYMNRLIAILTIVLMGAQTVWAQSSGSGTKYDPYIIANRTDLETFGSKMNNNTQYWKLGEEDIDLGGAEWTYGENSASNFKGHFDGNGKTIKNFKIVPTSTKNNGFFSSIQGTATSRAEVKNLIIDGVTITQSSDLAKTTTTGALAGNVTEYADITNVTVKNVSITLANLTNANYVGGFVGRVEKNNCKLKTCSVEKPSISITGSISNAASFIGGAIGYMAGGENLLSSINDLTVTSPSVTINKVAYKDCYIGAVFGRLNTYFSCNDVKVSNPTLTYKNTDNQNVALNLGSFAGGFGGNTTKEVSVTNVKVTGSAQLNLGTETNKGTTEVKSVKAGLIGQATTNVRLQDWTVEKTNVQIYGKLTTGASQIGAFAGNLTGAANAPTTVKNIKINKGGTEPGCNLNVTGDVTVACNLGGFAGILTTNIHLEGCEVTKPTVTLEGDMNTSTSYVGGVIGYIKGTAGNISYVDGLTVTNPQVDIARVSLAQRIGSVFGSIDSYDNLNKITVSNPQLNYSATGNPNVDLYLGTFAGYLNGVKEQETLVKNINITGTAELNIGTDANKGITNVSKVRAGLLAYTKNNVCLENWTIVNSNVQVYGSLTATADYFGGFAGSMESDNSAPLTLKNVKVTGNSTVNVTGNMSVGSYLGGFAGAIGQGNITYSYINIDDTGVTGTATVSVGGNVAAAGYVGGFTGYLYGKNAVGNKVKADNVSMGTINLTITGQTTAGSYYGGLVGRVKTMCELNNWKISTAANLTFSGDITALSYVGGAIGSLEGDAGYPSSATGFDVKGLDINLNGNLTNGLYVGGIAGQLNAVDKTNRIEKSSVSGKIHTADSHTFVRNKTYAFGGIVGYTEQSSTKFSEINNCVSEVDFNLSGYTPSDVSGSNYNLQQNGFVIGGVIGRINTPYRLPEYLYYSGKIYAPFAMVGPIVGVFCQNIGKADYAYNDYSGENVNAAVVPEMDIKEQNWYFNGYMIGLSSAVTGQTLNTTTTSRTTVDGVSYLTIKDNTLSKLNAISGTSKHSRTILAYTVSGAGGINPAWNTNSATYPAYYMYYMQGVNRGAYLEDAKVAETKKNILSGSLTLLTLTDANADFTKNANRGIISHALTATVNASDATSFSYKWYVDGVAQSETSKNFAITPALKGNTIAVEAIKGGKAIKRVDCKVYPVFRVSDASAATGTKKNPYLIGSADELQLLSYLSTLPLGTPWEKTYTSDGHYNKAYYELDNDIDLSGVADFTPISYATGFKANGAMKLGYVFDGVFDGKLHKISGMKEEWYGGVINVNDSYSGWGLFSVVGSPTATVKVGDSQSSPAIIRNLIIDGATLTHKPSNVTFNYNDNTGDVKTSNNVCIGVLSGLVLNNAKIDNIEIRNSKITDEGSGDYSLATRGLYVGSAVGSIQYSFNEQANVPVNTKLQHVAAQVDITLEHPTFVDATAEGQLGLFYIGGIIGRYCATAALQDQTQASMPAYTLYSGSVKATKAWISPVLGALRYEKQKDVSFKNYSKIWEGNNNTDGTQLTIANAQYYDFHINGTLITDLRPETACARGARPLLSHTNASDNVTNYKPAEYQGVNYAAIYLDSEGTSLEHLNEEIFDGIYWAWDDEGSKKFVHMTITQPMNVSVTKKARVYTANIENGSDPESYSWQESTDLEQWTDITDATSSIWNMPLAYNEEKYIVAHVVKDGKVYRSFPFLYTPDDYIQSPTIKESMTGSQHDFSLDWHNLNLAGLAISYQWYQNDRVTEILGETNETLSLTDAVLKDNYGGAVMCKVTLKKGEDVFREFLVASGRIVIFVNGNNYAKNKAQPGNDDNDGLTPQTPVETIDKANSLLDGGSWDKNIIVVMGTLHKDKEFQSSGKNPATLTGKWEGVDYEGVIGLKQIDQPSGEHSLNHATWPGEKGANCYVLGATKFEHLVFEGNNGGNCFIELHGNDAFFGKGLVMRGFKNLSDMHGNFNNEQTIPEFTVVLSATNPSKSDVDSYTDRTKPQEVTFQSGHYGRILAGRFTQDFFKSPDNTAHSILGSPAHPYWAVVNIDIDEDNKQTDGNTVKYSCDINGLIAGLTDGTMYGDYTINYHGGNVIYIVGSNQGNPINNGGISYVPVDGASGSFGQWPNASFFGRSVINVEEQTDSNRVVKVGDIYAGGLGRKIQSGSTATAVDMYLYGRTELNMIEGTVNGSVYGGGTGGVIGINPWDAHVPYATFDADNAGNAILNGVQYGDKRQGTWSSMTTESPLAKVILHNLQDDGETYKPEELDLSESSTTINITGGKIKKNVYGGGYGYVPDMPAEATMQGVGSVFGTSNVNITGGTIGGSVYGGSQGNVGYYGQVNKYGQVITHIAEMNGTVNINIKGDDKQYPEIGGDIYGGGQGIEATENEEYLRIATCGNGDLGDLYKTNINITIDLPESVPFNGNIYGGGEFGVVDGNTNVVIKRGTFNGNIFGGGKGKNDELNRNKAKVIGTTNVKIGEK